jgi:hypothetical protein
VIKDKRLCEEAKTVIWRWAENPDYSAEIGHPVPELASTAGSSAAPFDPVFNMLVRLQTQGRVDRVRWRLLLYFLAREVNKRIGEVGTPEVMVQMLTQNHWISDPVKKVLREGEYKKAKEWLRAGRSYIALVEKLGLGALISLPFIGESSWNYHCHPNGKRWFEILSLLHDRRVPEAAALRERHGNVELDAHGVATKLIEHLKSKYPMPLVAYRPPPTRAKQRARTGIPKSPKTWKFRRPRRQTGAPSVCSTSTDLAPRSSPPSGSTFEWELISGQPLAEYPATPSVATPSSLMSHLGDFEHCHVVPSPAF